MATQERGFTLIETLVSLAIAIVVGVLFFQGFVSGTRVKYMTDKQQEALLVARSRLAVLGFESPLEAGERNGVTATGIVWSLAVKPYMEEDFGAQNVYPKAFWATVTVRWHDNRARKQRALHLTTLKLGHIE